jgi:hypothetical protein
VTLAEICGYSEGDLRSLSNNDLFDIGDDPTGGSGHVWG